MTRSDTPRAFAILFVDDEEKARKYFQLAYAKDFAVLTAQSVAEALEVLEQRADEIGVLVTDQRMPGQKGVDLLKRAREEWPTIVRILTTAYSDLDDAIAAVNRGEILRYITKPWDIHALRVDLRHAMDFFLLRRERDLLLAEKFSVRQRMRQSDRLIGLLAIAVGLERLRNSAYAVAGWVRDTFSSGSRERMAVADSELWGLEVREALDLMQIHRSLRALDAAVQPGFPDRIDLAALLRAEGMDPAGSTCKMAVRQDLFVPMIESLTRLVGTPAAARLEVSATVEEKPALTLEMNGLGAHDGPLAASLSSVGFDTELLRAYLVAWHHGGSLSTTVTDGQSRCVLTIPIEPDSVEPPELDEGSLAALFSVLEDWG